MSEISQDEIPIINSKLKPLSKESSRIGSILAPEDESLYLRKDNQTIISQPDSDDIRKRLRNQLK